MRSVFRIVFVSVLPHVEFWPNNHREDTHHFINYNKIYFPRLIVCQCARALQSVRVSMLLKFHEENHKPFGLVLFEILSDQKSSFLSLGNFCELGMTQNRLGTSEGRNLFRYWQFKYWQIYSVNVELSFMHSQEELRIIKAPFVNFETAIFTIHCVSNGFTSLIFV